MAKVAKVVAAPGSLPSDSLDFCGGAMKARPVVKRKTPSELRGEQLKRRIAAEVAQESPALLEQREVDSVIKKPEGSRNTRYVDTRLDEVYPSIKPTSRLSLLSVKSNSKENQVNEGKGAINSSLPSHLTLKSHREQNGTHASVTNANDSVSQQCQTSGKDSQHRFRSVAELSLGCDRFSQMDTVDMDKVMKGLVARETSASCLPPNVSGKSGDEKSASLGNFCSEVHVAGRKVPLDLTLKTALRMVSSHPVNRFHRLLMGDTYNGMTPFSLQLGYSGNQSISFTSNSPASTDFCSLNSWIYPQSLLPPSVMSVLSSSIGGDFLNKRKLAWEDSFRSLYYMLRKSSCDLFYVCTSQFVVMFTAVGGTLKSKRICNAYISQSTRGLRSSLKEHDISFSMPFCCSEVEQISREDLVELSEIEKHNLGQAKRPCSMPDLDNSPQSLLAFNGNDSVHGLYDFLLNYRSLLSTLATLTSMDVPLLCAPMPFLHAALSTPEIRCKEIKRADALQLKGLIGKDGEPMDGSTCGICYSIEIKDAYLPPWIVCSLCTSMCSDGMSFEARFVTDPNSMGLNVALEALVQSPDNNETSGDSQHLDHTFGLSTAVITSDLRSASLKGLKYSDGSYVASLCPI